MPPLKGQGGGSLLWGVPQTPLVKERALFYGAPHEGKGDYYCGDPPDSPCEGHTVGSLSPRKMGGAAMSSPQELLQRWGLLGAAPQAPLSPQK